MHTMVYAAKAKLNQMSEESEKGKKSSKKKGGKKKKGGNKGDYGSVIEDEEL